MPGARGWAWGGEAVGVADGVVDLVDAGESGVGCVADPVAVEGCGAVGGSVDADHAEPVTVGVVVVAIGIDVDRRSSIGPAPLSTSHGRRVGVAVGGDAAAGVGLVDRAGGVGD